MIASGEAFQPNHHREQNILGAAMAQLAHDPQPELDALAGLDTKAEDLLAPVSPHPSAR